MLTCVVRGLGQDSDYRETEHGILLFIGKRRDALAVVPRNGMI